MFIVERRWVNAGTIQLLVDPEAEVPKLCQTG
jgi:hypothetical protein